MGKFLGYVAIAGLVWLTYNGIKQAKNEKKPKVQK